MQENIYIHTGKQFWKESGQWNDLVCVLHAAMVSCRESFLFPYTEKKSLSQPAITARPHFGCHSRGCVVSALNLKKALYQSQKTKHITPRAYLQNPGMTASSILIIWSVHHGNRVGVKIWFPYWVLADLSSMITVLDEKTVYSVLALCL